MFVSPTDAVKMYNVSKPTLYKDMSDGKLSFEKDNRDRRKINVAELDRIYSKREGNNEDLTSINGNSISTLTESNVNSQHLIQQIKAIREQIEQSKNREIELLEKQIEQLKDQNENLNRHLDETREEHRVYVRLLEDKREGEGTNSIDLDHKLEYMEQQLSMLQNQNKLLIEKEEERKKRDAARRRRIEKRRKEREEENAQKAKQKSRGLFERLFS